MINTRAPGGSLHCIGARVQLGCKITRWFTAANYLFSRYGHSERSRQRSFMIFFFAKHIFTEVKLSHECMLALLGKDLWGFQLLGLGWNCWHRGQVGSRWQDCRSGWQNLTSGTWTTQRYSSLWCIFTVLLLEDNLMLWTLYVVRVAPFPFHPP